MVLRGIAGIGDAESIARHLSYEEQTRYNLFQARTECPILVHVRFALIYTWPVNLRDKMTSYDPLSTVNDLFLRVASAANPRAVLWQDEFGHWQPISSDQIYQRVRMLAKTFLDWGAAKGDRIALISENRWEWAIADFAVLAIGAVDVPIYPTLTGEQIAELLKDAGCRISVVSTRQQFDKLHAVRSHTPLQKILMMDSATPPSGAISFSQLLSGTDARGSERDADFDALVRSAQPKDLRLLLRRPCGPRLGGNRAGGPDPRSVSVDKPR